MIVADTNLITYLINGGPTFEDAAAVYSLDSDWHAPLLWRSEFANILATNMRAGFIPIETAKEAMARAIDLLASSEHNVEHNQVLELAAISKKSAYDCEFVALAKTLGVPLVTNDGPLLKAFPKYTISIREFIK